VPTFTGNSSNNNLTGGSGDDTLDGLGGNDTLDGAGGWDIVIGGAGTDVLKGGDGGDFIYSHLLSGEYQRPYFGNPIIFPLLDTLAQADTILGGAGYDLIFAGFNDDVDGGADGASLLISFQGAASGVTADFRLLDTVGSLTVGAGTIVRVTEIEWLEGSEHGDFLAMNGSSANFAPIFGRGGDDHMVAGYYTGETWGGSGDDVIDLTASAYGFDSYGEEGDDTLIGGSGYERLDGGIGNDTLKGNSGFDDLYGEAGDDILEGGDWSDSLFGGIGADKLYGGESNDELHGGDGNDLLYGDSATPAAGGAGDRLYGDAGTDALHGGDAGDVLDGGTGADTMTGGLGNDVYVVDSVADQVIEAAAGGNDEVESHITLTLHANVEKLSLLGSAAIDGTGNGLANTLVGNSAANRLDGGAGADAMNGGAGDDVYVVDHGGDKATEGSGGGTDTVEALIDYTLGANVERLVLLGTDTLEGTGNGNANRLTGNVAANRLNGGGGHDTLDGGGAADELVGGTGNDRYIVDVAGDVIVELAGDGTDTVESSASYTLSNEVENLVLTGAAGLSGIGNGLANVITGNGAANSLEGAAGDDRLDGGAGADTMKGGADDDTYVIDTFTVSTATADDLIVEAVGGGTDTAESSVSYVLAANVENLVLTGAAALNGTGNGGVNTLTGNGAANRLDGMAGADTMIGGAGDDSYVVDTFSLSATPDDEVVEAADGGTDTVESSVSYVLAANVEKLVLTGTAALAGTGNGGVNTLTGNGAANRLDGKAGADTMIGGAGNDIYVVDTFTATATPDDLVVEAAAGGSDTVESSVSYVLAANVENLLLTGAANLGGTGNGLANRITGNSGANLLSGGSGADSLSGGAGADTLNGDAGNDRLDGGGDADTMAGGLDHDVYVVDHVLDRVVENGSSGTDTIESSVDYGLPTHVERLVLTGTSGRSGRGNSGNNSVTGNSGGNLLNGGSGNDNVDGGAGNDQIYGSLGNDVLKGGLGLDRFLFNTALGSTNVDRIVDFSVADDLIYLARYVFTQAGANGTLGAAAFRQGAAAADASDRIVYDQATGQLFYDGDGSGAAAQILFATVAAGTALTSADFIVYG